MSHPTDTLSENIEMYLLKIALLQTDNQPVPVPALAQELEVSPVSANEMCRKMVDRNLVQYEPYKGVTFTPQGSRVVRHILRSRRLWEVFFVDKLNFSPDEAEEIACRFEHVTPETLTERLTAFLGHPHFSPQNKPIPYVENCCLESALQPLTSLTVGEKGRIVKIKTDEATQRFLSSQKIEPGTVTQVLAVASDGALLLMIAGQRLSILPTVAEDIYITVVEEKVSNEEEFFMTTPVNQVTLDTVPVGTEATIVKVGSQKQVRRRMLEMGLLPGETITMKSVAPLGDPLELVVKGYQLSLRKHEARQITVELTDVKH